MRTLLTLSLASRGGTFPCDSAGEWRKSLARRSAGERRRLRGRSSQGLPHRASPRRHRPHDGDHAPGQHDLVGPTRRCMAGQFAARHLDSRTSRRLKSPGAVRGFARRHTGDRPRSGGRWRALRADGEARRIQGGRPHCAREHSGWYLMWYPTMGLTPLVRTPSRNGTGRTRTAPGHTRGPHRGASRDTLDCCRGRTAYNGCFRRCRIFPQAYQRLHFYADNVWYTDNVWLHLR